ADARRNASLQPAYLAYRSQGECWLHGLHLTEIAGTGLRDASSPYGYGGPVSTTDAPGFLRSAWGAYGEWMREHRVVVEYIRFHPLLANERYYGGSIQENRAVVCVDLEGDYPAGYAAR